MQLILEQFSGDRFSDSITIFLKMQPLSSIQPPGVTGELIYPCIIKHHPPQKKKTKTKEQIHSSSIKILILGAPGWLGH